MSPMGLFPSIVPSTVVNSSLGTGTESWPLVFLHREEPAPKSGCEPLGGWPPLVLILTPLGCVGGFSSRATDLERENGHMDMDAEVTKFRCELVKL